MRVGGSLKTCLNLGLEGPGPGGGAVCPEGQSTPFWEADLPLDERPRSARATRSATSSLERGAWAAGVRVHVGGVAALGNGRQLAQGLSARLHGGRCKDVLPRHGSLPLLNPAVPFYLR